MKKIIFCALVSLCFCIQKNNASPLKSLQVYRDTSTDNHLTEAEKSERWKLLFNGFNFDGWRTYKNQPGAWSTENGTLHCSGSNSSNHADLITNEQFENFELSVDWKIAPSNNSGIIYMATEENEHSYESGPEYQLIDDTGYPEKLNDVQKTGANYDMEPPMVNATKPPGEWNHTKIIVNNGHVEHWLNGQKVVEYELWSDKWKEEKAHSKWKDVAAYGMSKKGHIAFQDHGGEVWFKNVKIKML